VKKGGARVAVARRVEQTGLPSSRRTCAPPRVMPPPLVARRGLSCDTDWACRETEGGVAARRERRRALGVDHGLDSPTRSQGLWARRGHQAPLRPAGRLARRAPGGLGAQRPLDEVNSAK